MLPSDPILAALERQNVVLAEIRDALRELVAAGGPGSRDGDEMLTPKQIAELIHKHPRTVRNMLALGHIEGAELKAGTPGSRQHRHYQAPRWAVEKWLREKERGRSDAARRSAKRRQAS